MKSFLNKVTNPVGGTIARADDQRERFMATAARMEDVSLQAAGTPAAIAANIGLVVSRNLTPGMLVVIPLLEANSLTTREVFETAERTEVWRITHLDTDPLLGVEFMDMTRVTRIEAGMTRVTQATRRFVMRQRVLTPQGDLAALLSEWMAANALEPAMAGKHVGSIPTIGFKRPGIGVLGSPSKYSLAPADRDERTTTPRSTEAALQALQQFVSNPLVVDGTHETRELTADVAVEETKTRVVYQVPPITTAATPGTLPPDDTMVSLSTIQAIIRSMKETKERDRDTGHEAYTLDGVRWPCTIKGQGPTRMLKVNGPLRAMGAIRANVVFRDLLLDTRGYQVILGMISSRQSGMVNMPQGFDSMERLDVIWPLPWLEDLIKLESFLLMGEWPTNDWGQWSLRDFLYVTEGIPEWGENPDRLGMLALWSAVQKLEACLEVLFHEAFKGTLASLVIIILWECQVMVCGFVRFHIELMMATFWSNLRTRKFDLVFDTISMATPEGCAELLRTMAENLAESLKENPRKGVRQLERYPHTAFFHKETGSWRLVQNRNTRIPNGQKQGTPSGALKGLCEWHMCDMAGILDASGQKLTCMFKGGCTSTHPDAGADMSALGPQVQQDHFTQWRCPGPIKKQLAIALGRPDLQP